MTGNYSDYENHSGGGGAVHEVFGNGENGSSGEKQPDQDHIKMFVGQLPRSFTEEDCRRVFEEYGPIHSINMLRDKISGQGKGCCFITYYTRKAALEAQNALHNVRTLPGMHNPIQMKPADSENRTERKLFVGMISKKATEDDIRKMFTAFGPIEDCTILRDSNGSSRGCAFVTLASRQNSLSAIRVLHHSMTAEGNTSPMVVKMADISKDKDPRKMPAGGLSGGRGTLVSGLQQTLSQAFQQQQYYQALMQSGGGLNFAGLMAASNPQAGLANMNLLAQLQHLQHLTGTSGGPMNAGVLGGSLIGNVSTSNGLPGSLAALTSATASMYNQQASMMGYDQSGAQLQQQGYVQSNGQLSKSSGNPLTGYGNVGFGSLMGTPYGNSGLTFGGNQSIDYSKAMGLAAAGNSPVTRQPEGPENSNLFIYHLPPEYGDAELVQLFSNFGQLLSARVFIDKQTGLSKCFGFASYDNPAAAQAAISSMNGFQAGSKRLKVQLKRSREATKPY
ncbi:CUGBP Elav-like family member 1 [Hypsibius exemplaris]|uniref:CUGBP Elav-like family member 1 n=1 Tax=Hypsibius exemplaris TaxID=2072580 RepID=A0A1W0WY94_HYPEX|nr:CUGBP Elav-like family member 1 [Hypsibius exemplaris]